MDNLEQALLESENSLMLLSDEELITPINDILIINPETRLIEVPDTELLLGVFSENLVEKKYFKCPRIVLNNIDLYECFIFINYVSASGRVGYIQSENVELDETEQYILFDWDLTNNVFDKNKDSTIYFSVSAKQYLEDSEPVFATRKAQGKMYETINGTEHVTQEHADIILQILAEMDGVKEIATPDAMQEYVNIWLSENPDKLGGQPIPVKSANEMLNTNTIYLYMGVGETINEVVYEKGYIYYYLEGEQSWVKGSLYGGEGGGSSFSGNASDVYYDDTETNLGATNVQDAVKKISDKQKSVVSYDLQSLTEEQKTQARTNISAASAEEVGQLRETIADLKGNGGISTDAKSLLITILREGIYSTDQSENITRLNELLGSENTGDGNTPDTPDTPTEPETNIEWQDGYSIGAQGDVMESANFAVTNIIDVSNANTITVESSLETWASVGVVFYDDTQKYISDGRVSGFIDANDATQHNPSISATKPSNAKYARIYVTLPRKDGITISFE